MTADTNLALDLFLQSLDDLEPLDKLRRLESRELYLELLAKVANGLNYAIHHGCPIELVHQHLAKFPEIEVDILERTR